MDALDEQLAQLKLINSRSLSPRQNLVTSTGQSPKKIGPAVPPKPNKKTVLQVPQSSLVKQICEPDFSKRLENDMPASTVLQDQAAFPATLTSPLSVNIHQKKPHGNCHVYSNMKMTLDNPAILEQQLEALEYHKKQLEKKGMLPICTNKASLTSGVIESGQSNHLYSNVSHNKHEKKSEIVYSNILHDRKNQMKGIPTTGNNLVYSNVGFNNTADELPPPPPLDIPTNLNLTHPTSLEYLNQTSEDELPPPPSPVSSSYSELRRATDNFPQMPTYPISSYNRNSLQSADAQINDSAKSNPQQTYINTAYHNDYSTHGPSSQTAQNSSDYYGYGTLSQASSTYESIYEPINPRPPSQLSSRSNYSLYTSYINGSQGAGSSTLNSAATNTGIPSNGNNNRKLPSHKETEVEVLTDLLVHSMDSGTDVDSYGACVKCGERVVGENSGCTAMEQIYHITCFTCCQCQINLQGKPFYALEGKPYCEEDYLNTLEKCSVCMKPILERILRATGKPYHPQCFCCVVCGNSLDGIPFTVDATNQNYCIEDFHKKFAPRCCVCRQPIMPEPGQEETVRVVALDRSFHFECYKCEDCGLLLSSEAEGRGCYPLDDHVLCKSCNAKRVQALTNRMTTEL